MRSLIAGMMLMAGAAQAEKACFVSYADFEDTVKHLDFEACPGGSPTPEEGFCRGAVLGSEIVVYEFRHVDGEPCLVRAHRSSFNDFVDRYGVTYTRP